MHNESRWRQTWLIEWYIWIELVGVSTMMYRCTMKLYVQEYRLWSVRNELVSDTLISPDSMLWFPLISSLVHRWVLVLGCFYCHLLLRSQSLVPELWGSYHHVLDWRVFHPIEEWSWSWPLIPVTETHTKKEEEKEKEEKSNDNNFKDVGVQSICCFDYS